MEDISLLPHQSRWMHANVILAEQNLIILINQIISCGVRLLAAQNVLQYAHNWHLSRY